MKSARHEKIRELIRKYDIDTQEELASFLKEAGFRVTQATISRDIRALNMTKVMGSGGRLHYTILEENRASAGSQFTRVIHETVISVEAAQNLVVIRTGPGMAMAVAAALDEMRWPEVLGCIAGDDTIMCAARTNEEADMIAERMKAGGLK